MDKIIKLIRRKQENKAYPEWKNVDIDPSINEIHGFFIGSDTDSIMLRLENGKIFTFPYRYWVEIP